MARPPTPKLRESLVRHAVELVEEQGGEGLRLRELAERAGVSRQAPYLHFPDRQALLAGVAAEAYRRLRADIDRALRGAVDDPEARVRALAGAYAKFAIAHPELNTLMSGPYVRKAESAELQHEASLLFSQVRGLVAQCPKPVGVVAARRRTVILWAAGQGIVALAANRQIPTSVGASVSVLVRDAVDTLLRGWATDS
jgi:AcrR family transcriptional regulator